MAERPFRALVAGDLRLERPVAGLSQVPDALAGRLIDAPYDAARRVFDAALASPLDCLLLVGQQVDVNLAGPRGCLFLLDQFERLEAKQITVYWVVAPSSAPWPTNVPLPTNVVRLVATDPQWLTITRDQRTVAALYLAGVDRHAPFNERAAAELAPALPTLAVAAAEMNSAPERPNVPCWILAGRHARTTQPRGAGLVYWPGCTQSAGPDEPGMHGCALVEWETGALLPRIIPIDVDSVRWAEATVNVDRNATLMTLESLLNDQTRSLVTQHGERTVLARWRLQGAGEVMQSLRREAEATALVDRLRERAAKQFETVYHVSLDVAPVAPAPVRDDTLLDHYLQRFTGTASGATPARESLLHLADGAPIGWTEADSQRWTESPTDREAQARLVNEAAWLGVELLGAAAPRGREEVRT
ncbi:MAG: hypothetical protein JSS27_02685 [Planctomycetes bacterium]|nr:hypothetical protein [Planctomycetota bacterium]